MSGGSEPDTEMSEAELHGLLREALGSTGVPASCGIALEGSIAEGFGNAYSDIDFILIDDGNNSHPVMPTLIFAGGRRVEVRVRSAAEMRRQQCALLSALDRGSAAVARLDEEDLDICQRFARAVPMHNPKLLEKLRGELPSEALAAAIARWSEEHARAAMRRASAMLVLGCEDLAASWARTALTLAAKSWLAQRGETYLGNKWLGEQLGRVDDESSLRVRIMTLETPGRAGCSGAQYVEEVAALAGDLGVAEMIIDPRRLFLRRRRNVTTWQIGTRLHVVRDRIDVFALGVRVADLWRRLRFDWPLPEVLAGVESDEPDAGRLITKLEALGLLSFGWDGRGAVAAGGKTTLPAQVGAPVVSINGAVPPPEPEPPLWLVPLPAPRFAAAGGWLAYANMRIENAREDALGNLGASQWRAFERSIQGMVRYASIAILAAEGMHPVPLPEEAPAWMHELPRVPESISEAVEELDEPLRVDDRPGAEEALNHADFLIREIRDATKTSLYPSCFSSPEEWRKTVEQGYDWARFGAFVNAEFPLEQVRDLLSSSAASARTRPSRGADSRDFEAL
jgi:hypothetical protein